MSYIISCVVCSLLGYVLVVYLQRRDRKRAEKAWNDFKLREKEAQRKREADKPFTPRTYTATTREYVLNGTKVSHTTHGSKEEDPDLSSFFTGKIKLDPGNPFLANNMTQRMLFMKEHAENPDVIQRCMDEAKLKTPFAQHGKDVDLLKKVSSGRTISKKWSGAHSRSRQPDDSILNTVLATAVLNDAFISSDNTRSEPDTFSGNGGSFGGGGSSGSWDSDSSSSSSSSSYDSGSSGGGFDSGSSGGSFGD
jgi:hypothetical protein